MRSCQKLQSSRVRSTSELFGKLSPGNFAASLAIHSQLLLKLFSRSMETFWKPGSWTSSSGNLSWTSTSGNFPPGGLTAVIAVPSQSRLKSCKPSMETALETFQRYSEDNEFREFGNLEAWKCWTSGASQLNYTLTTTER